MSPRRRRCALVLSSLVLCVAGLLAASAPAGALVKTFGGQAYGLTPRSTEYLTGQFEGEKASPPDPPTLANEFGNPIVPFSDAYVIYWDPTYHYHGDWEQLIDGFFQNLSASSGSFASVFSVDSQYTDYANQRANYSTVFRAAYTDTDPYPKPAGCIDPHPLLPADNITCLTDRQLREELQTFIAGHALPKGMNSVFYLLTPPGVTVCLEAAGVHCSDSTPLPEVDPHSFCSYHSDISPTAPETGDGNTILYGVIPWVAGGAGSDAFLPGDGHYAYDCQDGGFNPASHPHAEEKEKKKEENEAEEAAFKKESKEEKEATERRQELEGPHEEEPNQIGLGPDGSFDTGLADLIIGQIAVEQQNIVTDPLLNAWQDATKHEVADECRNKFDPATGGSVTANEFTEAGTLFNQTLGAVNYYLNNAFNLAAYKLSYPGVPCVPGIRLEPAFSVPTAASAGNIVGFNGMESDITLDQGTRFTVSGAVKPDYPTFTWNFGDGSPTVSGYAPGAPGENAPASPCESPWETPCAGAVFHTYTYGGTYQVTLTVTDAGNNTASVTEPVTVFGPGPPPPPPPPPPPAPPAPAPAPSSTSTSGATGSSGSGGPPVPGPIARAGAVNTSLMQTVRHGLLVGYTVNEQVAGRFEVLLESSTARRLGIQGRTAVGLPAGSPPSLVIGQALLITTKGGHSVVRIKFSKRTSQRLRRVRKVTLLLRLVVRNAAKSPQSTTVLSPVVLTR